MGGVWYPQKKRPPRRAVQGKNLKMCKHVRTLILILAGGTGSYSQTILNTSASRELGQPQLLPNNQVSTLNPNLVEGRELYSPQSLALDTSTTPPALYVAD